MGIEIERKYLVKLSEWNSLTKPKGTFLRQGYLLTEPNKTIRVRIADDKAYLTIKGISIGASRPEFEYEVPLNDANELLDKFSISSLTKIRYEIKHQNMIWEVDEFLNNNAGLIIAEIELDNETQTFNIPEWIDKEVTGEEQYYNSNLSLKPFNQW